MHNVLGMTYDRAVIVFLVATLVVLVLHCLVAVASGNASSPRPQWSRFARGVYTVTVMTVITLGATSFYGILTVGVMQGWLLLIHVLTAGVFVVVLLLMAIMWVRACRFGTPGSTRATDPIAKESQHVDHAKAHFSSLTKLTFWLLLVSGVVTAGTMLLSMSPYMDTDAMHWLVNVHRYSGLLLVVTTLVHLYLVVLGRFGLE